jgi:hypothetical protein
MENNNNKPAHTVIRSKCLTGVLNAKYLAAIQKILIDKSVKPMLACDIEGRFPFHNTICV